MSSVFSTDKSVIQSYFELSADKYPGVYLTWDQLTSDDFGLSVQPVIGERVIQRIYSIRKAPQINGEYIEIARQVVPNNEFLDEFGKPEYYYKIYLLQVDLSTTSETEIAVSNPISGDEQLIKTSLLYEISRFLDIPVYDDQVSFNYDRTRATLSYGLICFNPRPEIRISAKSEDGYSEPNKIIDAVAGIPYTSLVKAGGSEYMVTTLSAGTVAIENLYYNLSSNGTLYFEGSYQGQRYPVAIPLYDSIYASYRVKMFSGREMNDALYQALQYINAFPGSPKFRTLISTPYYYEQALITIATYFLLRRLMMRLTQREVRLLLGDVGSSAGGEEYTGGISDIKEMLNQYKEQIEPMRKGAAYAYYPRIATTTTETYQLPGSRSYLFRSMFFKSPSGYG